ncbi:inner membrane protease [Anaeramoeba flamelloides]|uniref:Mitochondrial inner membrane protease ATP23 n=1 Tax=Anaeramoeba flamelloides TaxID=1746091 RepID=A0AAV7ZWM3_9EUKA|nr:inner membrane protease [Anaeramoeba flamelloides]
MFIIFENYTKKKKSVDKKTCVKQLKTCSKFSQFVQHVFQTTHPNEKTDDIIDNMFECIECTKPEHKNLRAFYQPKEKKITFCLQRLQEEDICTMMRHELVHYFDHFQGYTFGSAEELACSEIKAAKIGECKDEVFRKKCTRLVAQNNIKDRYPIRYKWIVNKVFKKCYSLFD